MTGFVPGYLKSIGERYNSLDPDHDPQLGQFVPDPEYELVTSRPKMKRGRQCGKCGAKFDHGVGYGFYCPIAECPMGWGAT